MRAAPALLLLAGCTMGPVDLTRIEDVRVIAAIAEPPEVAPGEPFTLTAVVAAPLGVDVEALAWWCPPEGTLPDTLPAGLPTGCLAERPALTEGVGSVTLAAFVPLPAWVLACEAGACGDLDDVPERDLRDPFGWLRDLPLEGVSAGAKGLTLTDAPPEERRANPVITEVPPEGRLTDVPTEETVELRFVATGGARASGFADAGGFTRVTYDATSAGEVTLEWIAPEDGGEVRLWVVIDDELGGAALWTGTATVR